MRHILIATALLLSAACAKKSSDTYSGVDLPLPKLNVEPKLFESCAEITSWQTAAASAEAREYQRYQEWVARQPFPSDTTPIFISAPAGATPTSTNIQEPGVDEPDFSKVSGANLLVARDQRIEIVRLPELRLIQTLALSGLRNIRLFAPEGRLVVMGTRADGDSTIRLYQAAENGYRLAAEHTARGFFADARLNGDRLLMLTRINTSWLEDSPGTIMGVDCTRIQRPVIDSVNPPVVGVHTLSVAQPARIEHALHIGGAESIYVSPTNVYFMGYSYSWFYWDSRLPADELYGSQTIVKYDWSKPGPAEYRAAGTVKGYTHNVWSFHENDADGALHLATTYPNQAGENTNRLWTLRDFGHRLSITGRTEEFGLREDIRSVRYMDDKAYIVTFQKTDPLFVFDLIQPDRPRLLSHLEVPGFSSYLHPSESDLIGIGYGATPMGDFSWMAGVQVSLFDNREPAQVRALEQVQFGARFSYTDVSADHHAFYYDPETRLMSVPVRLLKPSANSSPWAVSNELEFSGALIFNLRDGLATSNRLSHFDWLPQTCRDRQAYGGFWSEKSASFDIRRTYRVGDRLLTVSDFGAKIHDPNSALRETASLRIADPERECQALTSSTFYSP